jgi:hypothetical protein
MRQPKEGDVGLSPQLRTNKQNARRFAIYLTSARAPLIGSIRKMASERRRDLNRALSAPATGGRPC